MKAISLFAGIGGFDLALERNGYQIVYANEWDKYASQIYNKHFGEVDTRDITTVPATDIPDHDLLCGGFPCQAFSVAGKRAGFNDTRGTLFFEIARILSDKRPRHFLLENVKGLLSHDSGKTFQTILGVLSDLGYDCQWQVLNSKNFGVPQNRERVFIVGNLRGVSRPEVFPITKSSESHLKYSGGVISAREQWLKDGNNNSRNFSQGQRIYSSEGISQTLAGNAGGQGGKTGLYEIIDKKGKSKNKDYASTLTGGAHSGGNHSDMDLLKLHAMRWRRTEKGKEARRQSQGAGKDYTPFGSGYRELIPVEGKPIGTITSQAVAKDSLVGNQTSIRRLTPTECERLQGFPDGWTEGISDTQRYKCLGNAVTVNVVEEIVKRLKEDGK